MRLTDEVIDPAEEKRLMDQVKSEFKRGDQINFYSGEPGDYAANPDDDVLKPVELYVYLALLNSRDFADAVTEQQLAARAKRVSNYVPFVVARARELGWVK